MPGISTEPQQLHRLFQKASQLGTPFSGTFELTARCNLDCGMCYIHRRENDSAALALELPASRWIDIARQSAQSGTLLMLLTGGEPFVYQDFFEVYDACLELGMLVSINTNATHLTDSAIEQLAKNPPTSINVSLYGASNKAYERQCGGTGLFDRVTASIIKLRESNIQVKINYSVTDCNSEDMNAIFDFARENKLNVRASTYMFPPARACGIGDCDVCFKRPDARSAGQNSARIVRTRYPDDAFLESAALMRMQGEMNGEINSCIERSGSQVVCRAGSCTYWVTFDGRMLPCGMMSKPGVSLSDNSFSDAWEKIKADTAKIVLPEKCKRCDIRYACEMCAASCSAETGSFDGVPEYQCEKTRAFIEEMSRLEAETKEKKHNEAD